MSRYENAQPEPVVYRGKLVKALPLRKTPYQFFRFTYHQVSFPERIDLLAHEYVGNSEDWHLIADVNPERLYFGDLRPGEVLRIPYV